MARLDTDALIAAITSARLAGSVMSTKVLASVLPKKLASLLNWTSLMLTAPVVAAA